MATHNRAAFSRADVEDAKRGNPDFDLWSTTSWSGGPMNFDIDALCASVAAVVGSRATSHKAIA
jgi:hypothetical protein